MNKKDFMSEFEYELMFICKSDEVVKSRLINKMEELILNDYENVAKYSPREWARIVLDEYVENFNKLKNELDKKTKDKFGFKF